MSKKLEAKTEKSKLSKLVSSLIHPFRKLKLNIQQTAPSHNKSKSKNFDTKPGIEQRKSHSIHSKEEVFVCDSFAKEKENNSSLTDIKSSQLFEDPILQEYDEVKASCLHKNPIDSIHSAIAPTKSEHEVKSNNIDNDKSLNKQSESKIVSLFGNRSIKSEPVDDYDDELNIPHALWENKCEDSDKFPNEYSNHQNITCLENKNINDKETENVNYKSEPENDDENILERAPDKTSKKKERHSEYPFLKRDHRTAVLAKSINVAHIEEPNDLDREIEKIIADIDIEKRIEKIRVDDEIINFLCELLGPNNNNFFPCTDSISNPVINSRLLKTDARCKIFTSEKFSKVKCFEECLQTKTEMEGPEFISNNHKVIHYLKPYGRKKYRRTNLHDAVMNENLEKTLCILEIHKWCHNDLFWINAKDSSNPKKTALDWAYETRNGLLIDYLKENLATRAVYITPINKPGT